jgi:hypothetical protein
VDLSPLASTLLGVAQAAAPDVDRAYLAGGPQFARTCTLLAVYASLWTPETQGPTGGGAFAGAVLGGCAALPAPQVTLVYAKDCYPMPDTGPGQRVPKLPDPADLTAWTTDYLATCQAILDAVLDAHYAGTFGDCTNTTVGPATWTGPSSGVCTMVLPVTSRDT